MHSLLSPSSATKLRGAPRSGRAGLAGWPVVLGLLILGTPARARTFVQGDEPSLAGLELALQQQLVRIQHPPGRTGRPQERLQLEKALAALGTYAGLPPAASTTDAGRWATATKGLDTLSSVARHIERAKTPDGDVLFQVTAVRDTIDEFGFALRQEALTTIPLLLDEVSEEAILVEVLKADELRDLGLERWPGAFGAGAELLVRVCAQDHEALVLAVGQEEREALLYPVDIVPGEVSMPSEMPDGPAPFELDVQVGPLKRALPELTIAVRALSMEQVDTGDGMQPVSQATIGVKTLLDVQPGATLDPITVEVPPFSDEARVTHPGMDSGFYLGAAVDIDADTAVVGPYWRNEGKEPAPYFVTVLERNAGGLDAWQATARLEIPPHILPAPNESLFGRDVAVSGGTIVVGAPGFDAIPGGTVSGAAFVFERDGDGAWSYSKTIGPDQDNPSFSFDSRFGEAVDLDGDWLVVGAPDHDSCNDGCTTGTAYVFGRNAGGPGAWGEVDDLVVGLEEFFGFEPDIREMGGAVAVDDGLLLVGDPGGEQAFVFELAGGSWSPVENGWLLNGPQSTQFGASVAVAGSTLAIGAPLTTVAGQRYAGAAFVYERIENCDGIPGLVCYPLVKQLSPPTPNFIGFFGHSVALSDPGIVPSTQMLVVGSPGHGHFMGPTSAGSVYVYVQGHAPGCPDPMPPPGGWGLLARRVSDAPLAYGQFGRAVAVSSAHVSEVVIDGNAMEFEVPTTIFVGEPGLFTDSERDGAAHVFNGMNPVMAGEYQLAIEVDPHHRIIELDGGQAEENNVMVVPTPIRLCVPALDRLDLSVESVELVPVEEDSGGTTGFIIADLDGSQITRAGVNVEVHMKKGFEGPLHGARLSTSLSFQSGGQVASGKILDPVSGEYTSEFFDLEDLLAGDTISVHLDVEFTGPSMLPLGNSLVDVVARISSPGMDVDASNDTLTQFDQNWTTISVASCNRATSFEKQMGNDLFSVNAGFMGSLAAAQWMPPRDGHGTYPGLEFGAVGALDAGVSFSVFGNPAADVVRFRVLAERDPLYTHADIGTGYGFFEASLKVLGYTLYSAGPVDSFSVLPPAMLPSGFELLYEQNPHPDGALPLGFRFTKTFSKEKSVPNRDRVKCCLPSGITLMLTEPECCTVGGLVLPKDDDIVLTCNPHTPASGPCKRQPRFGRTFFPGGFPVDVDAAAVGNLGLDLGVEVSDTMKFDVTPHIGLGVSVNVQVPGGSPFYAGVKGTVRLIEDHFKMTTGLGMTVLREDPALSICVTDCYTVTNTISFLAGKIEAFAVIPWVKYFLKLGTKEFKTDLVNWKAPFVLPPMVLVDECGGPCTLFVNGTLVCPSISTDYSPSACDARDARDPQAHARN